MENEHASKILRAQAGKLEKTAKKLREAADECEQYLGPVEVPVPKKSNRGRPPERLKQLQALIAANKKGLTRSEIIDKSGIPEGTLGHLLKSENGFAKGDDDRWRIALGRDGGK